MASRRQEPQLPPLIENYPRLHPYLPRCPSPPLTCGLPSSLLKSQHHLAGEHSVPVHLSRAASALRIPQGEVGVVLVDPAFRVSVALVALGAASRFVLYALCHRSFRHFLILNIYVQPETAYRFMANTLLKTAVTRGWTNELDLGVVSAVALRLGKMEGRNVFIIAPQDDPRLASFEAALDFLNPECCFTLTSPAVKTITDHLPPDVDTVVLSSSLRIQVFDSWEELAHARPAQMACFVRQASTLVLWFDNAFEFATKTQQWEDRLVEHVWLQATGTLLAATQIPSGDLVIVVESPEDSQTSVESPEDFRGSTQLSDEEKSICSTIERSEGPRPVLYYNTVYVGISVGLGSFSFAPIPGLISMS